MNEDEANSREKSNECFEIIGDRSLLGPKEEKKPTETNGNGKKDGESSKSKSIIYRKVHYEI